MVRNPSLPRQRREEVEQMIAFSELFWREKVSYGGTPREGLGNKKARQGKAREGKGSEALIAVDGVDQKDFYTFCQRSAVQLQYLEKP